MIDRPQRCVHHDLRHDTGHFHEASLEDLLFLLVTQLHRTLSPDDKTPDTLCRARGLSCCRQNASIATSSGPSSSLWPWSCASYPCGGWCDGPWPCGACDDVG